MLSPAWVVSAKMQGLSSGLESSLTWRPTHMPKLNDHFPISVNSQHPPSTTHNKSPSAKTDYLLPCCHATSSQRRNKNRLQLVLHVTKKAPWANKLHFRRISFQISSWMRKKETLNLWRKAMTAFQNIHRKSIQNSDDKQSIYMPAFNQVIISVCLVCTWLLVDVLVIIMQYFQQQLLVRRGKLEDLRQKVVLPICNFWSIRWFKYSVDHSSPNQYYRTSIQFKYWDTVSS